jgi:hypothetical protein
MVRPFEGFLTTTVNDIEHIESQSLNGVAVIRVYFQPGAKIEEAEAQVTATGQTAVRIMPPGTQPPLILRYSASTVPILQLSMGSNTLPEQQLFDISANFLRTELATVQGAMIPWPYGGKQRFIVVDLEPDKLYGYGLSAADVSGTLPAGWKQGEEVDWLRVVEFLRAQHGVRGRLGDYRADGTEGSLTFKGPGYSADCFFDTLFLESKAHIAAVKPSSCVVQRPLAKARNASTATLSVLACVLASLMQVRSPSRAELVAADWTAAKASIEVMIVVIITLHSPLGAMGGR